MARKSAFFPYEGPVWTGFVRTRQLAVTATPFIEISSEEIVEDRPLVVLPGPFLCTRHFCHVSGSSRDSAEGHKKTSHLLSSHTMNALCNEQFRVLLEEVYVKVVVVFFSFPN